MTQEERESFAARLTLEAEVRFGGVAIRAYTAAGVNSATWKRAVTAQTIKPHKVRQIVTNLWPSTRGDWTKIPADPIEEMDWAEQAREIILQRQKIQQLELENERLRRAGGTPSA